MVQSNKVDFDVRKLRKRKKVSRDRMALPEHGECCIRRCRSSSDVCSMRLFAAKTTPLLSENSKDSATNNESNTSIKIVNLTLGYSLRANGHIYMRCPANNQTHLAPCILLYYFVSPCTQKESEIRTSDQGQCK
jgi:hypothetical protein